MGSERDIQEYIVWWMVKIYTFIITIIYDEFYNVCLDKILYALLSNMLPIDLNCIY